MSIAEEIIDFTGDEPEPIRANAVENGEIYEVIDLVTTPVRHRERENRRSFNWREVESLPEEEQRSKLVDLTKESQSAGKGYNVEQTSGKKSTRGNPPGIECVVCYRYETDIISANCGHICCTQCMTKILEGRKRCHICRKPINKKTLRRIYF